MDVDGGDLLGSADEGSRFAAAFDDASEFTLIRYLNVFWKVAMFLNIGVEATLRHRIKVVDEFVYKRIRARADEMWNDKAHDTEKISKEVKEAGNDCEAASVDEFSWSLTDGLLNRMHYLHATLTDTLRLYPSVPLVSRSSYLANTTHPELVIMEEQHHCSLEFCMHDSNTDLCAYNKECFSDNSFYPV
ncbi:hypothetical protein ACQ4PT_063000 [Festuca glaucescens]